MKTLLSQSLFLLFLLVLPFTLAAQTGKITGTVLDTESAAPLEFATITLLQSVDSSLIKGVVSDLDGSFEISGQPGSYIVKVEFIAYDSEYIPEVRIEAGSTTELGAISLAPQAQVMETVEVRAEKSTMQMALDKKIFNVGKDLASTSGSAAEVLDNIPSVQVDIEGQVSLRGSSGVRILVDGKPSGLIGVRGSNGLQSLPANLIERVEVITNPSARYEAEGMSGIINIVLKKDRKKGINGSFDVNGGNPASAGAAFNLNFRRDKLNFFTNYGFNFRRRPRRNTAYQEFYRGDSTRIVDQVRESDRGGISHNLRFGADYFVNDKNTITLAANYRLSDNNNTSDIVYRNSLNTPENLVSINTRTEDSQEDEPSIEFELNHKKTYERKGHEWTNTVQFRNSTEDQQSNFEEVFYDANYDLTGRPILQQRAGNTEAVQSLLLQSDYVYPFGEEGRFEAGYRGSFRRIDNDYLVEEFFDDEWNVLTNLSNDFNYDENIHAVYASLGNKINKFSYQFGLRLEHSEVLTELLQTNERNDRSYTNLFPSVFFTYDLQEDNSIQISYSRRLRRPRFWDLNPFFTFSDSRNIFRGNPNLDPEFTNSFEASHIKYWEKASISSSIYYRHSTGVINRVQSLIEDDGELITVRQPENLATEDAYGLEFIYTIDPFPWWRLNGSANFFRSIVDGRNFQEDLYQDALTWFTRATSRITIKEVDVQVRANYRAPRNTPQGRSLSVTSIDLGVSKDIFQEKGTLTVSVRDVFNSNRYRSVTFGESFYSENNWQRRPRQVRVTLNYRLNQKKGRRGGGDYGGGGEY